MKKSENAKKTIKLAPSILSADFSKLGEQLREVERCGAERIHIDVMDGHFVPPITMGPMIVESCRKVTELPLEVHLMVQNPESQIRQFADAGADIVIVHQETTSHLHRLISQICELGAQAGVALNPATPVQTLENIMDELDLVLIMTVNPGYSAQKFITKMLPKIASLSKIIEERKLNCEIGVDGGISSETARQVVERGANILVAASAVFLNKSGIARAMKDLRESALRAAK